MGQFCTACGPPQRQCAAVYRQFNKPMCASPASPSAADVAAPFSATAATAFTARCSGGIREASIMRRGARLYIKLLNYLLLRVLRNWRSPRTAQHTAARWPSGTCSRGSNTRQGRAIQRESMTSYALGCASTSGGTCGARTKRLHPETTRRAAAPSAVLQTANRRE
jgi:hypothetical protein